MQATRENGLIDVRRASAVGEKRFYCCPLVLQAHDILANSLRQPPVRSKTVVVETAQI